MHAHTIIIIIRLQMVLSPNRFSRCWQNYFKRAAYHYDHYASATKYTAPIHFILHLCVVVWCLVGCHARSFIVTLETVGRDDCRRGTVGHIENDEKKKPRGRNGAGKLQSVMWRPQKPYINTIAIISVIS